MGNKKDSSSDKKTKFYLGKILKLADLVIYLYILNICNDSETLEDDRKFKYLFIYLDKS